MPLEKTPGEAVRRPMRRDAQRNLERIRAAAREVFAERGEHATLAEVAARAQVGVGTVYRRYASKAALLDDLYAESVGWFETAVEEALAEKDSWDAFVGFIEAMEAGFARNRALSDLVTGAEGSDYRLRDERRAQARERVLAPLGELIKRAQAEGKLRKDFTTHDFELIHTMLASIVRETEAASPGQWRRYLEMIINGIRAEPERPRRRRP
jgi:AcrR family transcriptional regulator